MGVVYFGGELQASQGLRHVRLERTDHNEHESLRVSTQGELEQVGELESELVTSDEIIAKETYLAVPIWNVTSLFSLAKSRNHIA